MTSQARTSIAALPRGHSFPTATFVLSADDVATYLRATGDATDYGDAIPPLALVALGLARLQEQVYLPEGSLHTGQEVEHETMARAGEELTLQGHVAQRSERQGYVISVLEFAVASSRGVVARARTTIMAPGVPS